MTAPAFWILLAVVAGWLVQSYLAYQQSMAFNRRVRALRASGTVAVGVAGKRYRGGRAFVALAVDEHRIVRDAISLRGFTTFARAKPVPALFDVKVSHILGDRDFPKLSRQQREAARQAVSLLRQGVGTTERAPV
jgi:DNA-binding transcriptional regulator of glucitol operon